MGKLTPEQAAKNRERQRRYRERAFKEPYGHGLTRVNLALKPLPADALRVLAKGYAVTQRAIIERLLEDAWSAVSRAIPAADWLRFANDDVERGELAGYVLKITVEPLDGNAENLPEGEVAVVADADVGAGALAIEPLDGNADGVAVADAAELPEAVVVTDAVERARAMRAAGESYRAIAAALNAEGFPTRSGRGQWQPGSVQAMLRDA